MVRKVVVILVGALTLVAAWFAWELWARPNPFRAYYLDATAAESAAVTPRLAVALFALPCLAAATVRLVAQAKGARVAHAAAILGICLVLGALHAFLVVLALPYGFGSSYEHASPEQMLHLGLASKGGLSLLALGTGLAIAGVLGRPRRTSTG